MVKAKCAWLLGCSSGHVDSFHNGLALLQTWPASGLDRIRPCFPFLLAGLHLGRLGDETLSVPPVGQSPGTCALETSMTALSHGIAFFFALDTTTSCINWVLVFTCVSYQYCFAYIAILPQRRAVISQRSLHRACDSQHRALPTDLFCRGCLTRPVSAPSTDWHSD